MGKFEGNGAECYQKYHENGHKGTIQRMDHGEFLVIIPTWLSAPCTYTPPEPQWVDCTAGEALDAMVDMKVVQYTDEPESWVTIQPCIFRKWDWTRLYTMYRKEA